jgi:hypothetical protein
MMVSNADWVGLIGKNDIAVVLLRVYAAGISGEHIVAVEAPVLLPSTAECKE